MVDVLFTQRFDSLLGSARQLFVDVDIGVVRGNIFILDMDVLPSQPQNLTHSQRASKREIHGNIELAVLALIQRQANRVGIPDVPLFINGLGKNRIFKRILANQFPTHSLLECTTQELDDLFDGLVGHKLRSGFAVLPGHTGRFLERLNIFVYHAGRDGLYLQVTNDGVNVVCNQGHLTVVHGNAPLLFAVGRNKVIQELLDGLLARREKGACVLLVFNLSFAFQSFFVGVPGFPLLLGVTVFVNIVINDGICFFTFDDRSHTECSFPVRTPGRLTIRQMIFWKLVWHYQLERL